jgi:DNA-directed RNA polymerase
MSTIQEQLKQERFMVARGVAKQQNSYAAAEDGGRSADTSYGKALTRQYLPALVDHIEASCSEAGASRFGKFKALVRMVDADKAALLALRGVFQDMFSEKPLPTLAKLIGTMIEDEAKFSRFQDDHQKYYDAVIKDFQNKNTTDYRHRHRVLTFKMSEKEVAWTSWTPDEKLHVGMILLDCLIEASDLVRKHTIRKGVKTQTVVSITPEANAWIEKHKDHMALLSPEFMPCIIEPDDWTAMDVGGYYSPELRRRAPMVKTRSPQHKALLRSADLTTVMDALNTLQRTSWRVNSRVHDVVKEIWSKGLRIGMGSPDPIAIPPSPVHRINKEDFTPHEQELFTEWKRDAARLHTLENDRVKKNFQVIRLMRSAEQYREHDKFWYVYQTDFRGRVYAATAGFSPQGPDMGKALIEFATGKPLGDRGFYWLKVHFANLLGFDKEHFDVRAEYTDNLRDAICAMAADPLGDARGLWVNADKPFCALAAAFELADAYRDGPENTINRVPVALDGSCNGLQHYAAMLRDEVGAKATNVMATGQVADIYAAVGRVCGDRVRAAPVDNDTSEIHQAWLTFLDGGGLPRKAAKKPVMTLPYGATQRSCTDSTLDFLADLSSDLFPSGARMKSSTFLTKHLWLAIGDVVTSARKAMDWLQKLASTMAKSNEPLIWTTPTGFPVYQGTNKIKVRRIRTHLGGELRMQVGDFTDDLDPRRQSSGSAPNFVHSMDASHLMLAILAAAIANLVDFAVIHDSYGTYACDTDALHVFIRSSFVELYGDSNTLADFRDQQVARTGLDLPAAPAQGSFDVRLVMDSPFFFG